MEAVGVVMRPVAVDARSNSSSSANPFSVLGSSFVNQRELRFPLRPGRSFGFSDEGHLEYYAAGRIRCGGKKDKTKERLKMVKSLSKDLARFSEMGFGLGSDHQGFIDQVKGNAVSEAAELLLVQLKQLRAEEKEAKRRKKEEKSKLKAARMQQNRADRDMSSSSSSSSESSDSECGEVLDMNGLRNESSAQPSRNTTITTPNLPSISTQIIPESTPCSASSTSNQENNLDNAKHGSLSVNVVCSATSSVSSCVGLIEGKSSAEAASTGKIEVCMGGKCKKSGAAALLEQFQREVGGEGVVVCGCKCMGKCRDGPNVRVLSSFLGESQLDSVCSSSNPLCIGVGLEDVEIIVANFLGGRNPTELGLAAAA